MQEQWLVDYKPPLTRATRRREEILVTEGHVKREGLGMDKNHDEIREEMYDYLSGPTDKLSLGVGISLTGETLSQSIC